LGILTLKEQDAMKRKRYSDEQIAFALRQAESGTLVDEICRKLGVSEATFYRWKKQLAGMGGRDAPAEAARGGERQAQAAGGGSQPR
jgi:transposase-like protein